VSPGTQSSYTHTQVSHKTNKLLCAALHTADTHTHTQKEHFPFTGLLPPEITVYLNVSTRPFPHSMTEQSNLNIILTVPCFLANVIVGFLQAECVSVEEPPCVDVCKRIARIVFFPVTFS